MITLPSSIKQKVTARGPCGHRRRRKNDGRRSLLAAARRQDRREKWAAPPPFVPYGGGGCGGSCVPRSDAYSQNNGRARVRVLSAAIPLSLVDLVQKTRACMPSDRRLPFVHPGTLFGPALHTSPAKLRPSSIIPIVFLFLAP